MKKENRFIFTFCLVSIIICVVACAASIIAAVNTKSVVETMSEIINESCETEVIETETYVEPIETDVKETETETMIEIELETFIPSETETEGEILETDPPYVYSEPVYYTPSDRDMLAIVIYQEAGGEGCCDLCRRRVADVVLNRVMDSRFPNTILDVLLSPGQYGTLSYTGVVWPYQSYYASEQSAVDRAYEIADEVLAGIHSDLYGNGYIWQAEFPQGAYENLIYCENCGIYFGK